jgi:hypothetical protein
MKMAVVFVGDRKKRTKPGAPGVLRVFAHSILLIHGRIQSVCNLGQTLTAGPRYCGNRNLQAMSGICTRRPFIIRLLRSELVLREVGQTSDLHE